MNVSIYKISSVLLLVLSVSACGGGSSDSPTTPSDVTSGLVAAYTCDGDVNDSVGTAHGTGAGGFAYTDDRFGVASSACSFDGIDAKVNVGSTVGSSGNPGLSVSFWANTSLTAFDGSIITANGSRFTVRSQIGFTMMSGPTNTISGTLPQNVWSHIVATYEMATDSMKIYRDGTLMDEALKGGGGYGLNATSLEFGQASSSYPSATFWTGALDDIRFYNRSLTASEITNLYNYQKL